MTIDEAIKHCEEVAWENDRKAMCVEEAYQTTEQQNCEQCAADHRQLAEWLTELKDLRDLYHATSTNGFLSDTIKQLEEAKRLLRMALCELNNGTCSKFCSTCTKVNTEKCLDYKTKNYRWIHTAEALKLIGEDENVNT